MMQDKSLVHILKNIIMLALPLCAGRLLNILSSFFAMMMVAQFGEEQLAAGFLAISSTVTITTSVLTIFYSIGIRTRYYRGQNNAPTSLGLLVKNGIFMAMTIALPTALVISNMDKVLLAIGQEPHLVFLTRDYFYYASMGVLPLLIITVISQFYVGIGKPYLGLIFECISLPLTLLASYGLVLGHFGLPQLGLSGVSLANLTIQSLLLTVILIMIYFSKNNAMYQLFKKPFLPNWSICMSILALGLPIGAQFGGELAAITVSSYLIGYFGADALAALQITSQYSIIVIMLSMGLAQALSLMISEAYGKKTSMDIIKRYIYASLLLLTLYIIPITLLFCTLAPQFAQFYMGTTVLKPNFTHLIQAFFALSALFLFVDGMRNLLSGALRGLHDSKTATRINLLSMWLVSLPLSWLVVFVFKGGPIALRIGFLTGFIVAVISLIMYLYKQLNQFAYQPDPINLRPVAIKA
jgi:MATE family multidrug resistance protein